MRVVVLLMAACARCLHDEDDHATGGAHHARECLARSLTTHGEAVWCPCDAFEALAERVQDHAEEVMRPEDE